MKEMKMRVVELGGSGISKAEALCVIKDFIFIHLSHKTDWQALKKESTVIFKTTNKVILEVMQDTDSEWNRLF